jgi:hypothetical protein
MMTQSSDGIHNLSHTSFCSTPGNTWTRASREPCSVAALDHLGRVRIHGVEITKKRKTGEPKTEAICVYVKSNQGSHRTALSQQFAGAVCASDFIIFGTTPLSAIASKNRSTTALPCRRFDKEMCSFGKCACPYLNNRTTVGDQP